MEHRIYDGTSSVEEIERQKSSRRLRYAPTEKIDIIQVENFPVLGKLTALRFIEWSLKNPGGVISLPTGKTPEHFIKWVNRILGLWETKEIRRLLEDAGIAATKPPIMQELRFVQIDEFYPMNARQHNSFNYYVNEFYIKGFGLREENALLIDATSLGIPPGKNMEDVFPDYVVDLTLRVRQTRTDLERLQRKVINRVDEFCMDYESKIEEMGGIGFFLGGIGPDGHIAFNVRGSSVYSVTRLTGTNYETQAAAATDLGGIEISRNRLVITIGLATITRNPTTTAIIIAAGDAKAPIVAKAIQERMSPQAPASVLQSLPHARFYLTKGAASHLVERKFADFSALTSVPVDVCDDIITTISLRSRKALRSLTRSDFEEDRFGLELLNKTGESHDVLAHGTRERMKEKIERGLQHVTGTVFLHTEPHHDDVMLAYLAHIYHLVRDPTNKHFFGNITSGFTSVSNSYFRSVLLKLQKNLEANGLAKRLSTGYFNPENHPFRMEDVYLFLDGVAARSQEMKDEAEARRQMRNFVAAYKTTDVAEISLHVAELLQYVETSYPGAKDPSEIQLLKGMLREWEVELLWAYFGIESSAVFPLRLGFYKGDIFSEEPDVDRDVIPIFELIKNVKPNVVSVAFDPEGSGPDTHYKALQAVAEAVKLYVKESGDQSVRIWGYRNVWYRFKPAEANLFVPASLNSLSMMNTAFMNCFGSQSAASFPSYEYDGPFSELAQRIQVEQYNMVKRCIGDDYFSRNDHPRLRAARGMLFLKEMVLDEFFEDVRELKRKTENRP